MEQIGKLFIGNGMDSSSFGNTYDPTEAKNNSYNVLNLAMQEVINIIIKE